MSALSDAVAVIVKKEHSVLKTGAPSQEADVCMLVWEALAASGASWHVCRPISLTLAGDFEMERLHGLRDDVVNLEQLLVSAAAGEVHVSDFRHMFRGLVFQTLHALAMSTCVFNGLFRHNDLHARNVCFTPWNNFRVPLTARYTLPVFPDKPGDAFIQHHFLLTMAYRAVIIDYGWAALLPGMGPDKDSRFYKAASDSMSVPSLVGGPIMIDTLATNAACRNSGMSQRVPSQHYDAALLMYSLSSICQTVLNSGTSSEDIRTEMIEFVEMYTDLYAGVPHIIGRLQLSLQRELLMSKTVPGTSIEVPTPQSLLLHPYFAMFRTTHRHERTHVFGICSDTNCAPRLPTPKHLSKLAGKGQWTRTRMGAWTAPVDKFSNVLADVQRSVARWKMDTPKREMDEDEQHQWMTNTTTVPLSNSISRVFECTESCMSPVVSLAHDVRYISPVSPACGYDILN